MGDSKDKPRVEWLFINGSEAIKDAWLFSDFVGFYKAFSSHDYGNSQAFNGFPVNQYFAQYPHRTSITFGFKSTTDDTPLSIFRRGEPSFWTQLESTAPSPSQPILEYLAQLANTMTAGGIVNIVMVCHGYPDGDFDICGTVLELETLDACLSMFRHGVTINLFVKSCYSRRIVERLQTAAHKHRYVHGSAAADQRSFGHTRTGPSGTVRGSPFAQASVNIMTKPARAPDNLQSQIDHVNLHGRSGDEFETGQPQAWTSHDVSSRVLDVFYSDYIHIASPPAKKLRAASISALPQPTEVSTQRIAIASSLPSALFEVLNALAAEATYVRTTTPPDPFDVGFVEAYNFMTRASMSYSQRLTLCREVLHGMRWRVRIQGSFLAAWKDLVKGQKIESVSIDAPINFAKPSLSVHHISAALQCFEIAADCGLTANRTPDHARSFAGAFDAPTVWLATLIARSAVGSQESISHLAAIGTLGQLLPSFRDAPKQVIVDAEEYRPSTVGKPHQLFFWLPFGDSSDLAGWAKSAKCRYDRLKAAFESVMGLGTWGEDVDIQANFAELANSGSIPTGSNSVPT
ncbi:hypothetical protein N0V83_010834 [Neocucurbitaria cava]|uniref:Uncharacterized protein n=1 Tax=Neocucurbitaria cava TaxID=798079 RepID=A0A9W8XXZ5_9PLEO|nr:hypothetical protein N0V83_010834 [Neocucurbitaria cava]